MKKLASYFLIVLSLVYYPLLMLLFFMLYITRVYSWEETKKKLGWVRLNGDRLQGVTWFHMSSLGEYNGMKNFVMEYKKKEKNPVLITYFNPDVLNALKSDELQDAFLALPLENPFALWRMLKHYEVKRMFFYENEFWPVTITYLYLRSVPLFLINGFIQDREYRNIRLAFPIFSALFKMFTFMFVTTDEHKKRFMRFGVSNKKIETVGSLKQDTHGNKEETEQANLIQKRLGWEKKSIVLLVSIHPKEWRLIEEQVLEMIKKGMKVIVAPRLLHSEQIIEDVLKQKEIPYTLMSRIRGDNNDVLVVDTFGQMHRLYPLADVCFVGGSLIEYGGHNVLEPISHNVKTLTGQHHHHFSEIVKEFEDFIHITSKEDLLKDVEYFLKHPQNDNGYLMLKSRQGVWKTILEYLERL